VTKSAGTLRFYQQGKLVQQVAAATPSVAYGRQQLTVGRGGRPSDDGMDAILAAAMIWNVALSNTEVAALNSLYKARYGLLWC
jgi:hypothetical protein